MPDLGEQPQGLFYCTVHFSKLTKHRGAKELIKALPFALIPH